MRGGISSQVRLPSGPATSGGSSCSLAVVTESPKRPELSVATQAGRSSGSQHISAGALWLLGACGSPKRGAPGRREPGRHPQVDVRHDLEAVIIRRHCWRSGANFGLSLVPRSGRPNRLDKERWPGASVKLARGVQVRTVGAVPPRGLAASHAPPHPPGPDRDADHRVNLPI